MKVFYHPENGDYNGATFIDNEIAFELETGDDFVLVSKERISDEISDLWLDFSKKAKINKKSLK